MALFDLDDPDGGLIDLDTYVSPKKEEKGDFARGVKESFQQLPQLGYGLMAGAGAGIESLAGEGGIGTGLKNAGVKGYNEWGDKIAKDAKESDSWNYSYDKAKEGDFGALVDWVQHGIGYVGGQGLQMLATAGIGAAAGKLTAATVAKQIAEGMVAKEAATIAASDAAATLSAQAISKLATANVAAKFATIGQNVAIGASAMGMEGGEIFGDLSKKSVDENRSLTGSEIGKAFASTLAAGGLEFVGDKIGLDILLGKSKLLKPAGTMTGLGGRAARGAIAGVASAPIEGGTEYLQTGLEEYGKGNEANALPFNQSEAAQRQAVDAAALGAVGGGVMGGAGGAIHGAKPIQVKPDDAILSAPTIDHAIAASVVAQENHAAELLAGQARDPLVDAMRLGGPVVAQPLTSTPQSLFDRQIEGGNPLMDATRAREDSTQQAIQRAGEQFKSLGIEDPQDAMAQQKRENALQLERERLGAMRSKETDQRIESAGKVWQNIAPEDPLTALQRQKTWAPNGEPADVWLGRRGDGYLAEGDAAMALDSRQRRNPDLNWQIEQMPNGKYRIAGYTNDSNSTDVLRVDTGTLAGQGDQPSAGVGAGVGTVGLAGPAVDAGSVRGEPAGGAVAPAGGAVATDAVTPANAAQTPANQQAASKNIADNDQLTAGKPGNLAEITNPGQTPANQPTTPANVQPSIPAVETQRQEAQAPRTENGANPASGVVAPVSAAGQPVAGTSGVQAAGVELTPKLTDQRLTPKSKRVEPVPEVPAGNTGNAGNAHIGRNNIPVSEGGKPFKTQREASIAKKQQPMMRVVKSETGKGFVLAPKTEKQIAAQEKAAKRLSQARTSAPGEPIPAHAFIASEGGLKPAHRKDLGVEGNPQIGNRSLYSGLRPGLSIEQATQRLIEEGYLSEGATHSDALALIKKSLTNPQYNADGIERLAEMEMATRYEDHLAVQEEAAQNGEEDPFAAPSDAITAEALDEAGYDQLSEQEKTEFRALVEYAGSVGVDTESILEDIAQRTENATDQEYRAAARQAIEAAVREGEASRSDVSGGEGAEAGAKQGAEQGLTSPTQSDILTQQDRQEQAAKSEAADRKAAEKSAAEDEDRKRIAKASEAAASTFTLGGDAMDNLTGQGGMFSRAKSTEPARDLIIQHNLTAENLLHADKMGGMAVPSLAVTKANEPMMNFGEITLLGDRDMADPTQGIKMFGADIYSPRYPTVNYQFTTKAADALSRELFPGMEATGSRVDWDEVGKRGAEQLKNEGAAMWAFLKSKGIEPEVVMEKGVPAEEVQKLRDAGFAEFFPSSPDAYFDYQSLMRDEKFQRLATDYYNKDFIKAGYADLVKSFDDETQTERINGSRDLAYKMRDVGAAAKINQYQTRDALRAQIRGSMDDEFSRYAEGLFDKLNATEKIFQGFTNAGNRKYTPHTLDNVIAILKKELRGGESFNYGAGSLRAKFTPQFKSIKAIHEAKTRLVTKEQFEAVKDEANNELQAIASMLRRSDTARGEVETDTAIAIMEDAPRMGLDRAAKQYNVELSDAQRERIGKFLTHLKNMPTQYFEGKMLRSVGLGEFKAAVVPEGIRKDVLDVLEREGVTVFTYKKNDEADRARAVNEAANGGGLVFSRSAQFSPAAQAQSVQAVESIANAIASAWQNGPRIVVAFDMQDPRIPERIRLEDKKQRSGGAQGAPEGFYYDGTAYLMASQLKTPNDTARVLFHEALGHFGLRSAFGGALKPILQQIVTMRRDQVDAKVKEYGLRGVSNLDLLTAAEEVLAEMAQTTPEIGFVKRAIAAIRTWLRNNVPGFKDLALTDAEVIANYILPARGWVENGGNNGGPRGGIAFARAKAADQTATPAFKAWFGDSKVVDDQGRPLVVYHGTPDATFSEFRDGAHFTENPDYAAVYTNPSASSIASRAKRAEAPATMPVYLSIKNPFDTRIPSVRRVFEREFFNKYGNGTPLSERGLPDWTDARDLLEWIEETGQKFDGILIDEGGTPEGGHRGLSWVPVKNTQIKSSIGNNGNFDPTNPDILFSRSVITGQTLPQSWQAPAPTKMDNAIYAMQDSKIDTKRVVQAVRDTIGSLADEIDPYLQEELFHGRAAMQTKEFLEKQVRPLLTDLQARGVDLSDFEEYLHNRHAERRNVQVAKVNPAMQDGGSGIMTQDARDYLANLTPEKKAAYEALAKRVDAMTKSTRDLLISAGLEKQETIDAWDAAYGNEYVPLMREEMDNGRMGIGQGFSVRGSSSKRAMGSQKPVANILANIALQHEKAITRSEKQKIGQALYGMVLSAPNPDFWIAVDPALQQDPAQILETSMQLISLGIDPADAESIAREPTQRYIHPVTGQVAERINPALRSADNVLAVRINGEDKYVFFNERDERAMRMAKALKNLDADQLGTVMGSVAKMTRYFAAVNTQYNPLFGVTNIIRDVQTALLNLQSTELKGKQKDVMKNVLSALRGIYIDLRDHRAGKQPSSAYAQLFEEFQREGGATGYRDMYANAQERADAIRDELEDIKSGKLKSLGKGVFGWLSDYNEAMENAVRVSAYKVAKENGMSNQQAASLAKNISVNFNRKGQVALQAGALFAFFNASMQGTARLGQTMFKDGKLSSTGKNILKGGLLLGAMQAMLLAAAGFDDGEPPDFVRERNIVLPIGDKKYITIPMPLGFHVVPNLGRIPAEWIMGGFKNTPKRIAQLVGLFADAFNPIGSAGLSIQTIAPTVIDPFVALSENRDWTGKPIAKVDRDAMHPTAGHTRAKDTATPWAKFISYAVNYATGGTDFKPGLASPTPDQIDYLIGQVTGGVGREVGKIAQIAESTASGEEVPLYKIPLVGRFVGTTEGQAAEASRFYDNLRTIGEHKVEVDGLIKDHRGAEAREYMRENREASLYPLADATQRQVAKLNTLKRDLIKQDASKDRIKLIDMQITTLMKRLNDTARTLREQAPA